MRNKTGVLAKLGVAAAMVCGLTVASQTAAAAAPTFSVATATPSPTSSVTPTSSPSPTSSTAPPFSVSPSSGLHHGDIVTVKVTGAGANEVFGIAQCSNIGVTFGCDGTTATTFTTDANGAATFTMPVHQTFEAVTYLGLSLGKVDCGATSCYIGAGNQNLALGDVPLSFG